MKKNSFKYWFSHWCAYNLTAIKLKSWKFRYLFHDWEKPILKLFCSDDTVKNIHRLFSRHHFESMFTIDYKSIYVDWECSRLTKSDQPLTAEELYDDYTIKNKWISNIHKNEMLNQINYFKNKDYERN